MDTALGVAMRVPGLFIIDYWWRHDRSKFLPHSVEPTEILNCIVTNLILLHGFLLLLLPLRYVRALYTHFVSGAFIFTCHIVSSYYVEIETNKKSQAVNEADPYFSRRHVAMVLFHIILGSISTHLLKGPWPQFPPVFSIYALPIIARCINLPLDTLPSLHEFCSVATVFHVFLYISYQIPDILDCAKLVYMDVLTVTEIFGIGTLFTVLWNKLFVPTHFAFFWLIEFIVKLIGNIYQGEIVSWGNEWYIVILSTISSICASPVTLVATSVTVSYLSFFILCSTRAFLQGPTAFLQDNPMHSGWTEGLTLVLLSIQTGLIEMKMPARMAVMIIILFIVFSSLLQSMLEIAEPVVLSLSASRSRNFFRHFRALSLCLALLIFPLYLTKVLSSVFPIDFWMLVVLSSCILTSVQVLDLLVVHSLFLYDSWLSEHWENLDDIVYYTRAVTKVLEFFVALFVVGMGLWESTTGKWNWVNASILLVHCYFNVWQRLQTGWHSFLLRREASKRAESLPPATEEQLVELDDVCSICFGGMKAACVTPCQHYFHRTCLRKWLYVQDKCPLCHGIVSLPSTNEEHDSNAIGHDHNDDIRLNNQHDNESIVN